MCDSSFESQPEVSSSSRRSAARRQSWSGHLRTMLSMLLVWGLLCQTATPRVSRATVQPEKSANGPGVHKRDNANWLEAFARAVLPAYFEEPVAVENTEPTDTLTDAVISRTAPTINSGRIEGTLRVLKAEAFAIAASTQITGDVFLPGTPSIQLNSGAQHSGTIDDGGPSSPGYAVSLMGVKLPGKIHTHAHAITLPSDFPSSVPAAAGLRTLTIRTQSDVAAIGDWQTVRDLSVTRAGLSIDVPPGNYGTFTVNGNSRLNFTAGTYNFANTFNLDGSASLQATGVVTINVGQNLTINSGALVLGSYTSPGDVRLNVLGSSLNINGSSQVSGLVRAYNGAVTLNGTAQVRGQVIANSFTLNGGKVIGAVWPAISDAVLTTFGPRRFDRTDRTTESIS